MKGRNQVCPMRVEGFKEIILAHSRFPEELRVEVIHSSISQLNFMLGVVPIGMSYRTCCQLMNLEVSWFDEKVAMPLLPPLQCSWDSGQIADWLVGARIVNESRRATIIEDLEEDIFPPRDVLDVLTNDEHNKANFILNVKIYLMAPLVWELSRTSNELCTTICCFFDMDLESVASMDELVGDLIRKLSQMLQRMRPSRPDLTGLIETLRSAFHQEYLGRDTIAKSFIGHVVNLTRSDPSSYFACYTFLGQGSGTGKSRLLSESWEDEEHALFILRINCSKFKEIDGYSYTDFETSDFVRFILGLRSLEQMSRLMWCLLSLVFDRSFDENGFLKFSDTLSCSFEDLHITFNEVHNMYCSVNSRMIENGGFSSIRTLISRMKLKRPWSDVVKSVIPIITFDEASILIQNHVQLETYNSTTNWLDPLHGEIVSSFGLIMEVLSSYKTDLWACPFVFAAANTKFLDYVPSISPTLVPSEEAATKTKLFNPYWLSIPFNIFANDIAYGYEDDNHLETFILSSNYSFQLCKFGRPLWAAMLQADRTTNEPHDAVLIDIMKRAVWMIVYKPKSGQSERLASTIAITSILTASDWSSTVSGNNLFEKTVAFLLHPTGCRCQSNVSYPPEPVLAIAALKMLHRFPSEIMEDLTRVDGLDLNEMGWLAANIRRRDIFVALGEVDEFVAKILVLLSLPSLSLDTPNCLAGDLLQSLLGVENMMKLEDASNTRILLQGRICFSYFTAYEGFYKEPLQNLRVLVRMNAALSIPVHMKSKSGLFIPIVLKNGKLGCIVIQATNASKGGTLRKFSGIPQMHIILNMLPHIADRFTLDEKPQCTTILLEGWKSCFGTILNRHPSLCGPLKTLLSSGRRDFPSIEVKESNRGPGLCGNRAFWENSAAQCIIRQVTCRSSNKKSGADVL